MKGGVEMNFIVGLLITIIAMIIGAAISYIIFTVKKKSKTVGDLHILPGEDGLTACYVAWETMPENLIKEDYVLLKVIHKPRSQN